MKQILVEKYQRKLKHVSVYVGRPYVHTCTIEERKLLGRVQFEVFSVYIVSGIMQVCIQ